MSTQNETNLRMYAFNELKRDVDGMAAEIDRLASTSRVTAEEVQALASYLTRIRLLANEVEYYEVCANRERKGTADRFSELESMISVLRSDLRQIAMRGCS